MIDSKRNRAVRPKKLRKQTLSKQYIRSNGKGVVNIPRKSMHKSLVRDWRPKLKKPSLSREAG